MLSELTKNGKYMEVDRKNDCLNIVIRIQDIVESALSMTGYLDKGEVEMMLGINQDIEAMQNRMYQNLTKRQILEGSKYVKRYVIRGTKSDFERLNKLYSGIRNIHAFGHRDDLIFISKLCEVLHDVFVIEVNDCEKKRSEASKKAAITVKENRSLIAYRNSKTLDEYKNVLKELNKRNRDKEMSR
jgi:hypothetical protein